MEKSDRRRADGQVSTEDRDCLTRGGRRMQFQRRLSCKEDQQTRPADDGRFPRQYLAKGGMGISIIRTYCYPFNLHTFCHNHKPQYILWKFMC